MVSRSSACTAFLIKCVCDKWRQNVEGKWRFTRRPCGLDSVSAATNSATSRSIALERRGAANAAARRTHRTGKHAAETRNAFCAKETTRHGREHAQKHVNTGTEPERPTTTGHEASPARRRRVISTAPSRIPQASQIETDDHPPRRGTTELMTRTRRRGGPPTRGVSQRAHPDGQSLIRSHFPSRDASEVPAQRDRSADPTPMSTNPQDAAPLNSLDPP